ncbi:alpha/beta fold hydrolase [Streptomyces sp. DSM 116496]|uniref:alpha/beta fold hydrolase n=1 Tax=Streptomyces stoeckheimensis TaxID=3344656 RepID=UPI0038B2FB45
MAVISANGIDLSYTESGSGDPVLLVMGTGARGHVWNLHQVPALHAAGYRTITFDNRGISPSSTPDRFTLDDMVGDTVALIEKLGLAPCRMVGVSLGAFITQELLTTHSEWVEQAVLIATRGRTDALRAAMSEADLAACEANALPSKQDAVSRVLQNLSPRTQNDDVLVKDWLDLFEMSPQYHPDARAQLALDRIPDRRSAYAGIRTPTLVMSFRDDVICPPHLGREVADAIPGSQYVEVADSGHLGYLEQPGPVNSQMVKFFSDHRRR